ncbi:binding-protein-dependent transport system inner membrane protein [Enterobacter cancerogenus]|uniref:Binding-protein-dependent transport system inner membrane protein n=1 Tax=Enterobacter cancerogenus TaxID=69218 RepID=A0A484Z6J6_9ENTR|nr:binding-protein-dependent transport system inner membrane protein [Enterobacter cancerogenus]
MLNYVCKRLLGLIPTLFIVAVLVFLFVHLLPGDPARLIAGPEADATVIDLVRKQLGLDQPLYKQFLHYMANVLQGDFGTSMVSRRPVSEEIASRFMPTFWLTLAAWAGRCCSAWGPGLSPPCGATAGRISSAWRWP